MQLPNRFHRYAVLRATAMTMGLLLYGCGESKVAQCNKIVTVANKTKTLTAPKDVAGFNNLADSINQIRVELQAITVKNSQLKDSQTKLLSMYGDVSSALKAQAKATEAKDTAAQTKAKQELEAAASKESELVDTINSLCSK